MPLNFQACEQSKATSRHEPESVVIDNVETTPPAAEAGSELNPSSTVPTGPEEER